jgi:hypothetical protein
MTIQQRNDATNKTPSASSDLANDREKGSAAREQDERDPANPSGQRRGGTENFADDPERAGEAGRKGGQRSHGEN